MKPILMISAIFHMVCSGMAMAKPVTVDDVMLMTEEYPPFNFTTDGELKGFAADIMVLMLETMKSRKGRKEIEVVPWARGYKTVLETPNSCLFTMAWSKSRSKRFKFVGPLEKFDSATVFAKKSRRIRISRYQDLLRYKVGVLRHDVAQDNLVENGIQGNLVEISSPDSLAKMLAADRIDLWAYGELSVPTIFKNNGIDPGEFESVFSLKTGDSYYAFNRETPDAIVEKFQQAFDALKKNNRIQPIVKSYIKKE